MAKRRREKVSDGTLTVEEFYTAFIDTSLDTHLAMIISSSDTVSDVKKKIVFEHSQLFPRIGGIKVCSLQVKRQGHFYHLPDSMLVVSAYEESKRHKNLFVDVSTSEEHDREQHSCEPDTIGHVGLLHLENCPQVNKHNLLSDDPSKGVSFDHGSGSEKIPNVVQASPRNFHGEISKYFEMEVSHVVDDCQKELSSDITRKSALRVCNIACDKVNHIQLDNLNELSPESRIPAKKRKAEYNENGANDSVLKANSTLIHTKRQSISGNEIVDIETSIVDAEKNISSTVEIRKEEVSDTSSSDANKIAKSGAPNTSQSEPSAEKNHKDNSASTNGKEVAELETVTASKCTTDTWEDIFGSNVTSEHFKDGQLVTSLGSKKGKKKRKKTSSVPCDQAAISKSTPVQNMEEEENFKGNLEIDCKDLDSLSDSFRVPGQNTQHETFSIPSGISRKTTHSDLAHEMVEGSKRATCPLEDSYLHEPGAGNAEGKISVADQTAEPGVYGKTSMKFRSTDTEEFASPVITGLDDMNKVDTRTHDESIHLDSLDSVALQTDRKGHTEMALNHDQQVMPSGRCKPSDEGDADGTNKESIFTPKLFVTSGPMETVVSDGTKRKKKRAKNKASAMPNDSVGEETNMADANSLDAQDLNAEHHISDKIDKNESMLPLAKTDQTSNQDPEGKISECFNPAYCGEADTSTREAVLSPDLLGSNEALEAAKSTGEKSKKRKTKKSAAKIQDISEVEHDLTTIIGISLPVQEVAFNNQISEYAKTSESNVTCMETDHTTEIGADKELSTEHGTQVTLPTGSKPPDLGETNANVNVAVTTAMLLDAKDVKSGSRRKKKRTTKSAAVNQDNSSIELANTLNGLSAVTDSPANHVADEMKNAESILSQIEVKEASKGEAMDHSASGAHREGDKVSHNEVLLVQSAEVDRAQENTASIGENVKEALKTNQSSLDNSIHYLPVKGQRDVVQGPQLDQSGGHKENEGSVDKKAKKKKKKNQIFVAEVFSSSGIKDQDIVREELAASGVKSKGMDNPSNATKTSGSAKKRTVIESTVSKLELETSTCSNPEHAKKDANPSEVSLKGRPETEINNEYNMETAKGEDEGINFRHYFVPGQHQKEVASSVKVKEQSQSMKLKRKKEKRKVVSESTLKSSEKHGNGDRSDGRNINDNQLEESASIDKQNKDLLWGDERILKTSEDEVKAPTSHEVEVDKTLEKAIKPALANGTGASMTAPAWLEENKASLISSSLGSSSKGSTRVVNNTSNRKQQLSSNRNAMSTRNISIKSAGDLLNSSGREKSLFTTPRAIFWDDSSESSGDENKIVNSDASTRTPSDSSSSSGYSVGESELSQGSKRNGFGNAARRGGKNIVNSKLSVPQNITMDMVLKSSSRFKKAKLTASQSQAGDTESQPVDFVPDSQAN